MLRLLAGAESVVVLSTPAGSGKSIAARPWIAADDRATATLRLPGHLDVAVSLAQALLDALETFGDSAPRTRARMTGREPAFSVAEPPALATVTQNRTLPFSLLVDDVHVLQSPAAQQVLAVCESVPTRLPAACQYPAFALVGMVPAVSRLPSRQRW